MALTSLRKKIEVKNIPGFEKYDGVLWFYPMSIEAQAPLGHLQGKLEEKYGKPINGESQVPDTEFMSPEYVSAMVTCIVKTYIGGTLIDGEDKQDVSKEDFRHYFLTGDAFPYLISQLMEDKSKEDKKKSEEESSQPSNEEEATSKSLEVTTTEKHSD